MKSQFKDGFEAYKYYDAKGLIKNPHLTLIHFERPSYKHRMVIYDMSVPGGRIVGEHLVAHGKNSGGVIPNSFSNKVGSLQSSLGAALTGKTYIGKYGRSLKLHGLEKGLNDNMYVRSVVLHGSNYVSEQRIKTHGSIGRSWGCPAVDFKYKDEIVDLIKEGSLVFSTGIES